MHQQSRTPAAPSSAPKIPAQSTTARDDSNDPDSMPVFPTTDGQSRPAKGLGINAGAEQGSEPLTRDVGPQEEALTRLNQIISNYHTKAALIILQSRVQLSPAYAKDSNTPKINRWFNVELEESDVLRQQLWTWRNCDAFTNRPPPLIIETYLDPAGLTNNQSLVIIDDNGKRWDVQDSIRAARVGSSNTYHQGADEVILERWRIELGPATSKPTAAWGPTLPTVYKKSIILFRSLFAYTKFLPVWKFSRRLASLRRSPALEIKYRILDPISAARSGRAARKAPDNLMVPLYDGTEKTVDTYSFGTTDSPAGPFSVQVTYRLNCDFRVDDSEALLSSRFMGADDDTFLPSLPSDDVIRLNAEVGSVPVERKTVDHPDRSRAYGSLSTFHQVGPAGGSSPISALRAARDSGVGSSSPSDSPSKRHLPATRIAPTGRAAQLASESVSSSPRRPSLPFPVFKAPTVSAISASPAPVETPLGVSPRTTSTRLSTGTSAESRILPPPSESRNILPPGDSSNVLPPSEARAIPPSPSPAASAPKPAVLASEQAISSSTSASPKPAPIYRFSSSFSNRRKRFSSGGTAKMEDDTSSGKASAASSNVQQGSGFPAEVMDMHADDEEILEFLKLLDANKGRLSRHSAGPHHVDLAPFHKLRASNDLFADTLAASMHMRHSSTSSGKQLSGVPPISGTSISTASSPGKPISPHTPHTPAIRSRLSSNSVVDEVSPERESRGPCLAHDSPLEEHPSLENTQPGTSTAGAIDIPTSPRVFPPAYRRSSSAAQHRAPPSGDDEEIFSLDIRSMSLGAETPGPLQQRPQSENPDSDRRPTEDLPTTTSGTVTVGHTMPRASPSVYQPRSTNPRGRGYSGGHSLGSASSSLARGATVPSHLAQGEDRDGNASGSNSGNSVTEPRRDYGHYGIRWVPPPHLAWEDDEPLLFAMSDFGASRRSLEENRPDNHGAESSANPRRGAERRGGA